MGRRGPKCPSPPPRELLLKRGVKLDKKHLFLKREGATTLLVTMILYFRFQPAATLSPAASIVKLSLSRFVERILGPFVYDALPDQFVTLWIPVNLYPNLQTEKKIFFSMDKRQCVSETQLWVGS